MVCDAVNQREVYLLTASGQLAGSTDCQVACIELRPTAESDSLEGSGSAKGRTDFQKLPRNEAGGFWQVYQPNRWRVVKERAAADAAMAAAALGAS